MSKPTIYGVPFSTFVRTARMACREKGVDYDLVPAAPHSDELGGRHPFGKVPAFEHGAVGLFESMAIAAYVDEAFDGPALQPADAPGRARMRQWISAYNDSIHGAAATIAFNRLIRPVLLGEPGDEAAVSEALPKLAHGIGVLDAALADSAYLAGTAPTLADLQVYPMVSYLPAVGCGDLLDANPNVREWSARMAARPSALETQPELAAAA